MKQAKFTFVESTDAVQSYNVLEGSEGGVIANFPSPLTPGETVSVVVDLPIGPGKHTFFLQAVASDGTPSSPSNGVDAVFPVAAPVLLAVEPV